MGDEESITHTLDNSESPCLPEDVDEKSDKINELFISKNGKKLDGDGDGYDDDDDDKERLWRESLNICDTSDNDDDDDEVFITTTTKFTHHLSITRQRRCISECSDSGRPSSDGSTASSSQRERVPFRRDRSRSEPVVQLVDVVPIARELRRISDEFHSLYTPTYNRPSTSTSSGGSPFSNAGTRLLRNLRYHMFGVHPIQRQRSYSETHPPGHHD